LDLAEQIQDNKTALASALRYYISVLVEYAQHDYGIYLISISAYFGLEALYLGEE
jgi:hypothetical protein